ncbi:unnamed protein product [Auanema sp. JU1783]|nr:unnamed protein product [Auanema sp. JU1783]
MSWGSRATRAVSVAGLFGLTTASTPQKENSPTCPILIHRPEQQKGDVQLSRKVVNHLDKTGLNLRLYQYETCPFCCKVRAFLSYYGFSHEVVEVNPVTRSQIKFSTQYKKVPIIRSNNEETLYDSSLIISMLGTYLHLKDRSLSEIEAMYPSVDSVDAKGKPSKNYPNKYFIMLEKIASEKDMASAKEEREWREWVDDHFIHLISPNVYGTWEEALSTFKWFEQVGNWEINFPYWERILAVYVGAAAMWALSKRLKKKHNIDDERTALRDACNAWMDAIGPNRKFMGGDRPNLADISLYGAMNSFYGCQAFKEVIVAGSRIGDWHTSMKKVVEEHEGRTILESIRKQ